MRIILRILAVTACLMISMGAVNAAAAGLERATQERLLQEATDAFREGNQLRAENDPGADALYEKAALRFERIIREGEVENGLIYYNLGNIWFQRGDLGRAMVNYLRAERFIPNNDNLQKNIGVIRQQRKDFFQESEKRRTLRTLFFWHYDFPSHIRLRLFGGAFLLVWILATARLFWKRRELTVAALVLAGASGLLFLSLSIEASQYRNNPKGVVIAEESIGRNGDGETYEPSFSEPIHAGTEFTVRDDRGSWIQVTLPDERTCWLQRDAVALVSDPVGGQG